MATETRPGAKTQKEPQQSKSDKKPAEGSGSGVRDARTGQWVSRRTWQDQLTA